jgi:putative transposase
VSWRAEQRRSGCQRLHVLSRLDGHVVNSKKTPHLYREEGLMVWRLRGRRRATGMRAPFFIDLPGVM